MVDGLAHRHRSPPSPLYRLRTVTGLIGIVYVQLFLFYAVCQVRLHSHDLPLSQIPSFSDQRMLEGQNDLSPFASHRANATSPPYFMVFSTSCSDQQDWESYLFFFRAFKVRQRGTVTRIASGCTDEQQIRLWKFHHEHIVTMNTDFKLHFTPDFSTFDSNGSPRRKNPYKYMNKPYGLRHWMEHELGISAENRAANENLRDGIVMLLDPDMVLLQPLTHDFSDAKEHLFVEDSPITRAVTEGHPIAQQDAYLSNEWMKLDLGYITNLTLSPTVARSPSLKKEGPIHWNTGPPYLATVKDMHKIAVKWTEYAPRVYDVYPKLYAEMYGFIIATLQLNLPHTLLRSLTISSTATKKRESWTMIDALPQNDSLCIPPPASALMPISIHYCQHYRLGRSSFLKYRVKKNILSCDQPLLSPIDSSMLSVEKNGNLSWFEVLPPVPKERRQGQAAAGTLSIEPSHRKPLVSPPHREFFMLCTMTRTLNEALRHYKQHACNGAANLAETYSVYDDPAEY